MKVLYFDISGTLIGDRSGDVKSRLAGGIFEAAVRDAGFDRLVCVSSLVGIARTYARAGHDPHATVFRMCRGAFADVDWFRGRVDLPDRHADRIDCISFDGNWWYLDDLAASYCGEAGLDELFREESGRRICAPEPRGDGRDVLTWIAKTGNGAAPENPSP